MKCNNNRPKTTNVPESLFGNESEDQDSIESIKGKYLSLFTREFG